MTTKRSLTNVLAVVALLLLVAACQQDADEPAAEAPDGDAADEQPDEQPDEDPAEEPADEAPEELEHAGSLSLGQPSIPPVFPASLDPIVADGEGLFEKYGVDVELRPFETGVEATRAAAIGEIDVATAPTSPMVVSVSEGADLTGVIGLNEPTWLIGSTHPDVDACEDLEGHTVAVDAVGGIRYIVLTAMLESCGVSIDDVSTVDVHVAPVIEALVAGQLDNAVLHLYEFANVTAQLEAENGDQEIQEIIRITDVTPDLHFVLFAANADAMENSREALVRFVAAMLEAREMIRDTANHDRIAEYGPDMGLDPEVARLSMELYMEMEDEYWTIDNPGMDQDKVEGTIQSELDAGNIEEDQVPEYEDLVDEEIWQEGYDLYQQMR